MWKLINTTKALRLLDILEAQTIKDQEEVVTLKAKLVASEEEAARWAGCSHKNWRACAEARKELRELKGDYEIMKLQRDAAQRMVGR